MAIAAARQDALQPSRAIDGQRRRRTGAWAAIASQRVGAKRRPMTGSAKQSSTCIREKLDCFVASAPRKDGVTIKT
jgi:hypothetical protein